MKKVLFLIAAMMAAVTMSAQVNVAQGKHVYPIGDYVGNVTDAGLQSFTDGDENGVSGEANLQDGDKFQAFYIDLEEEVELGAVAVKWEGACAKDYKIYATAVAPASLDDLAGIEPAATVVNLEGGAGKVQTKTSPVDVKARYISFVIESASTGWNVKIMEIYAYLKAEASVAGMSLSRYIHNETSLIQGGGKITMEVMPVDDMDIPYTAPLTYTVAPEGTATVENGIVTISGINSGTYTLTATDESGASVSRRFSVVTEPAAEPKEPEPSVVSVFSDSYKNGAQPGISDKGWNWGYVSYEWWNIKNNFSYYVHQVGTFGLDGSAKELTEYPLLNFDIFAAEDINNARVTVEGVGDMPFTVKGGEWNHIVLDYSEKNLTRGTWVQFYIGADKFDNDRDVLLDNIYFTGAPYEDEVAPVLVKAESVKTTAASVKFALQATDEPADKSKSITYTISNGTETQSVRGGNGEEIEYVFSGLQSDTEYTFTVVAEDANANASATKTVVAKTQALVAAPVPAHNKHLVRSVYSDTYETITPNLTIDNWGSRTQLTEIEIEGNKTLRFNDMDYYGFVFNRAGEFVVTDSKMETLHIDIYAENDGTIAITPIWWNVENGVNYKEIDKVVTLEGGKWNQFDIDLKDFADADRAEDRVHQLKLSNGNGNNLLVDNIYFWKNAGTLASKEVSDAGVNVLEGEWDDDMFAMIDDDMTSSAYDLTAVTALPEETVELKAHNAYAFFITAQAGTVAVNELVKDGEGYKSAAVKFVEDGEGVYALNTSLAPIAAETVTVERHLASGNVYTTVTLPFSVAALPEGVKAYTLDVTENKNDEVTLYFKEAESMDANKPYIVYAPSDVLSFTGAATMTFEAEAQKTDDVTFVGNYAEKALGAEDNAYVMPVTAAANELEFAAATESALLPFGAYMKADGKAQTLTVSFGTPTGIQAVSAETAGKLFDVYTVNGQQIMRNASALTGLKTGVYLVNGKKVVIK